MERCAFAEKLTGSLKTHIFYATKNIRDAKTVADVNELGLAPIMVGLDPKQAATALRKSGQLNAELEGLKLSFPISGEECAILELMNGSNTRQELLNILTVLRTDLTQAAFNNAYDRLFGILNGLNLAFLRRP